MAIYRLVVASHCTVDNCWQILEKAGWLVLYSIEDAEDSILFATAPEEDFLLDSLANHFSHLSPTTLPTVDWQEQWKSHSASFSDGFVHVTLADYNSHIPASPASLQLEAGVGFGDLSHPTTLMTLKLMSSHVKGRPFVDIGCGSGILAIAAAAWGASPIVAIDIDVEAINHAIRNLAHNNIDEPPLFTAAEGLRHYRWQPSTVAAMNMVTSEQDVAWHSLSSLHPHCTDLFVSGIYGAEKHSYLRHWQRRGWHLAATLHDGKWHAFHLSRS